MRDGVKWNDGQAFTAKDVEFTFNMIKQHKALDLRGLWRYLASVTAPDDKTAEFKFKVAGAGAFTEIDDVQDRAQARLGEAVRPGHVRQRREPGGHRAVHGEVVQRPAVGDRPQPRTTGRPTRSRSTSSASTATRATPRSTSSS